jgi:hypothetical protein
MPAECLSARQPRYLLDVATQLTVCMHATDILPPAAPPSVPATAVCLCVAVCSP